jgi:hypothetical protein
VDIRNRSSKIFSKVKQICPTVQQFATQLRSRHLFDAPSPSRSTRFHSPRISPRIELDRPAANRSDICRAHLDAVDPTQAR